MTLPSHDLLHAPDEHDPLISIQGVVKVPSEKVKLQELKGVKGPSKMEIDSIGYL